MERNNPDDCRLGLAGGRDWDSCHYYRALFYKICDCAMTKIEDKKMNETLVIGGNNPPDEFIMISEKIKDLYQSAKDFLDGDPIATQGQADSIEKILVMIKAAEKEADEHRKYENTPFDLGKAAIQKKYASLIGKTKETTGFTVLAKKACQDALTPWKRKLQAAKDEEARIKREEADKLAREAQEAIQAASLEDREAAEKLLKESNKAKVAAKKAEKSNVLGMRTVWDIEVVNPTDLLRHYWATRKPALERFAINLAEQDVKSGTRKIPGCTITPRKVAK